MMVVLGGVLLEMGIGSRFMFFHSADYKADAWWALGVLAQPQSGRLLSVNDYRHSVRACDQKAVLAVQVHSASMCLEGIAAIPITGNRPVTVLAKQSAWGLLVVGIRAQ